MRSSSLALPLSLLPLLAHAAVHTVDVGETGLEFDPKTLSGVKKGDTVVFSLYPKHNVVSGPFSSPCTPTQGDAGFYSGPFANTDNGKKKFVVNVTSDDAVYYYCGVPTHCANGMVGGWNIPSSGDTIDAYASAAAKAQASSPSALKGGQLLDDSAVASLTSGASSASGTPAASGSGSSASSGASTTPAPSGSASGSPKASGASATSSSTNAAPVVGGEVGGLVAIVLGALAYLV